MLLLETKRFLCPVLWSRLLNGHFNNSFNLAVSIFIGLDLVHTCFVYSGKLIVDEHFAFLTIASSHNIIVRNYYNYMMYTSLFTASM